MKKVLKLDTYGVVTAHDYAPDLDALRSLIGPTCEDLESVRPGLFHNTQNKILQKVMMLVDGEGKLKELPVNPVASYLYGAFVLLREELIVGDVLFVGTQMTEDGPDICGLEEDSLVTLLRALKLIMGEEV